MRTNIRSGHTGLAHAIRGLLIEGPLTTDDLAMILRCDKRSAQCSLFQLELLRHVRTIAHLDLNTTGYGLRSHNLYRITNAGRREYQADCQKGVRKWVSKTSTQIKKKQMKRSRLGLTL